MKKIFIQFLFLTLFSFLSFAANDFTPSKFSNKIVIEKWNSIEGIKRLNRSKFKNDFYQLSGFFQPQINPFYCGIASSVIILNAINDDNNMQKNTLKFAKPKSIGGGSIAFNSFSQLNFLNEKTDKIKDRKIINMQNINDEKENIDPGLTLTQLKEILEIYDLQVQKFHIAEFSQGAMDDFRRNVQNITSEQKKYLLINFKGNMLGLKTGGHISPLVAYDKLSDSVLMLDVAGHKNSWYWVNIEELYRAMNIKDGNQYRGYLIIEKK